MSSGFLRYENRLVGVLAVTFGVVFLDRSALNFLSAFVVRDLHITNTQIGLLASGLALTWAVSGVVVARLTDRIGRQRLILAACILLFSLCSVLSSFAGSFAALLVSRLVMGLSEGPVLPIAQSLLARESSPDRRGFNMGLTQQFGSNLLGSFIAPILLVAIATRYGWRGAFFVSGLPGLLCVGLAWATVRDPPPAAGEARGAFPLRQAFGYRNVRLCTALAGLMIAQGALCFVYLPLYFVKAERFPAATMGVLMSLLGASAVVASVAVPWLADRYGRKRVVVCAAVLALVLPVGALLARASFAPLAACLFFGFALSGAAPLVMAAIPSETLPSPNVAGVIGVIIGVAEVTGGLAGPSLGGVVADRYGLAGTLWLQLALVVAMIGLACALVETRVARPALEAPAPSLLSLE